LRYGRCESFSHPPAAHAYAGRGPRPNSKRDYDALKGCRESPQLDFKEGWYRLEDDQQKAELAKDLSAMANGGGGYIIRGVATERLSRAEEEVVSSVKPIPDEKVDREQHRSVVKAWCFPQVRNVEFHWHPAGDAGPESERGVFVIEVPPQDEDDMPFLVIRVIDPEGRKIDSFAIAVRDGAHTDWLPPGVIWRDLSDGRRVRHARSSEVVHQLPPAKLDAEADVDGLLDHMEQYMGWTDGAGYYIAALPTRSKREGPEDFYSRDGLYGALSKPPSLRWSGFGLSYEDEPERVGPDLVVSSARERCLWLRPNGLFAAGMNAKGEFLSWGFTTRLDEPTKVVINPWVLVEFTLLYTLFVRDNLRPRYGAMWDYHVEIRGARERPWHVALGFRRFPLSALEPTGDLMKQRLHGAHSPPGDAYRIVASVYDFFGADRSGIPFVTDYAIDEQKIIAEAGGNPG
jgi:Putative DNA-binding domain